MRVSLFIILFTFSIDILTSNKSSAAELWSINVTSDLSKIDQFENQELEFEISIRDKNVINFLDQPGAEVGAGAILAPVRNISLLSQNFKTIGTHTCYNPKPKALGGNSGGSALRPQKSGDQNQVLLKYKCWFPTGIKTGDYTLNIKAQVTLNGSCCSMPTPASWDNSQVFLFGNIDESLRPSWFYETGLNQGPAIAPYTTIQRILSFPTTKVIRIASKTSPENLTFNAKNLQDTTLKLNNLVNSESELQSSLIGLIDSSKNTANKNLNTLKNLGSKTSNATYKLEIADINSRLSQILEDLQVSEKLFEALPVGSIENNVRLKYLYGLDFDVESKPEVLIAQLPDFKKLNSNPTPYLRFVIKSKTSIINSDIALNAPSIGGPVFQGNVVTPGSFPINDQSGGGLVLVESQQWDGSLFLTSILVGPKYTPVQEKDLTWMRAALSICGKFTDAAGNVSDVWNLKNSEYCGDVPVGTQAESAASDFDKLIVTYQNVATANAQIEKSKFLSPELVTKLSEYQTLPAKIEGIKSEIDSLSNKIAQEQKKKVQKAISCVKGKVTKKITGPSPKCPSGFTRK